MNHQCSECRKEFSSHSKKANHIRWCHRDNTLYLSKLSSVSRKREAKKRGKTLYKQVFCRKCSKPLDLNWGENNKEPIQQFCSQKCANSHKLTNEVKKKISEKIQSKWEDPEYAAKCTFSNQQTRKRFSSVGERELRAKFQQLYPEDEWVFGGRLVYNELGLVRDLYSNKLKVCIEYDGIWHFKDINGQLEKKRAKDRALEEWCIQNKWRLIRIRDEVYQRDKDFWFKKLVEEAQKGTKEIQKFYN